ncbi:hypothetical protein [Kineococcus auxinigenes]|uniref:hypothetical protein n=1 Tax=unclassified Kineococcus TaxID=2621656 RepID=UPI003D7CA503
MARLRRRRHQQRPDESASPTRPFLFDGLSPWASGHHLECEVGERIIDLHGDASFRSCAYLADEKLQLKWHYGNDLSPREPELVTMTFFGVRDLVLTQDRDLHPDCREDTGGWHFQPGDDGFAHLDVSAGEMEVSFRAMGVHLILEPVAAPSSEAPA